MLHFLILIKSLSSKQNQKYFTCSPLKMKVWDYWGAQTKKEANTSNPDVLAKPTVRSWFLKEEVSLMRTNYQCFVHLWSACSIAANDAPFETVLIVNLIVIEGLKYCQNNIMVRICNKHNSLLVRSVGKRTIRNLKCVICCSMGSNQSLLVHLRKTGKYKCVLVVMMLHKVKSA